MALDFPANPTDGQIYEAYVWSASSGVWKSREESATVAVISSTVPESSTSGDIWIDSTEGSSYYYYNDGTSGQWVELISSGIPSTPVSVATGGTGATSATAALTNLGALPTAGGNMTGMIVGKTNTGGVVGGTMDSGSLSARGDATNAAVVTFHRPSYSWTNIGLDTDNNFKIGGGSLPTTAVQVDTSGRLKVPQQPSFLVYSNTGTAYKAANSWEDISRLKTSGGVATVATRYNVGNHFDSATGRFTAPVTGQYAFYAGGWASYNGAGNRYAVSFTTNNLGTNYISGANYSAADSPLAMSPIILNLAANDYVILQMFSSVATILGTGSHFFYYGGYLLG